MRHITEKIYIGKDYCFSVTEADDCFVVSICSENEYYESTRPDFYMIGIYEKKKGWNTEKIEALIKDEKFLAESVKLYIDCLSTRVRSRKINQDFRDEYIIREIKEIVSTNNSTCWTLEEASKFSKIGINRLRKESLKKDCKWVLWIGETKRLVKIEPFKEWVTQINFID